MRFSLFTQADLENGPAIWEPKPFFYKLKQRDILRLTSLIAVCLALFFLFSWSTRFPRWKIVNEEVPANFSPPPPVPRPEALDPLLDPLASVNGPPTASLWGLCLSFMF
jgi:hypothetical protein